MPSIPLSHGPKTRYQFRVDGRSNSPARDTWLAAAQDAVTAGYATWVDDTTVRLASNEGAEIARI